MIVRCKSAKHCRWQNTSILISQKMYINALAFSYLFAAFAGQWIQVNLKNQTRVTGVVTQGRPACACTQWVTQFKMMYSNDGANFKPITDWNGSEKVRRAADLHFPLRQLFSCNSRLLSTFCGILHVFYLISCLA